jgi:hypothetical protein
MTARRRHREQMKSYVAPVQLTDAERFAAAVKATEAKKRAEIAAKAAAKQAELDRQAELKRQADEAARHAAAVAAARTERERAVERLKDARRAGRGVPEAESAWRDATAMLVELETGERATWDRRPKPQLEAADTDDAQATEGDPESSDELESASA